MLSLKKTKSLLSLLQIQYPIIQAPMAGMTTPALVAAVCNEACLGSIGAGLLTTEQLDQQLKQTKLLTEKPFAVNLFAPAAYTVNQNKITAMQQHLNQLRAQLNIPPINQFEPPTEHFEQLFEVVLNHQPAIFSFTFGIPEQKYLTALKTRGIIIIGTATNLTEAKILEAKGCDAIVAQGYEAGGHRGTFVGETKTAAMGLMALIPQLVDNVNIPVIAAGGIMDGRGILASFALGAAAAQMGTLFLTCPESAASSTYQQALLSNIGENTLLTRAFTGKYARAINNTFIKQFNEHPDIADFPLQTKLTKDIRQAAAQQNNPEYLALWAGQGVGSPAQAIAPVAAKLQQIKNYLQQKELFFE